MTAPLTPGTRFRHPLHDVCTVTRVTPRSVRYTAQVRPGWPPRPHTTTPDALAALLAAGILVLLPPADCDPGHTVPRLDN